MKLPIFLTIAIAVAMAGCREADINTGYLRDYETLARGEELDVRVHWVGGQSAEVLKGYDVCLIGPIEWRVDGEYMPKQLNHLRDELRRIMVVCDTFPVVSSDMRLLNLKSTIHLVLELALTRFDEGNGAARYLVGLGAGQCELQLEGRLRDSATGETVFSFVDRLYNPGNPYGGFNLSVLNNEKLSRETLTLLAARVSLTFQSLLNPEPNAATDDVSQSVVWRAQ